MTWGITLQSHISRSQNQRLAEELHPGPIHGRPWSEWIICAADGFSEGHPPGIVSGEFTTTQSGEPAPGNPVAFADALEQLAQDRSVGVAMGRRGRVLAEMEFSREELAGQFLHLITDMIA